MAPRSRAARTHLLPVGLLVAAAGVALALLLDGGGRAPSPITPPDEAAPEDGRGEPTLLGSTAGPPRPPPGAAGAAGASGGGDGASAAPEPVVRPSAAVTLGGFDPAGGRDEPLAPGAVVDAVTPTAGEALRLRRSDLLGRTLPYGLRDRDASFAPRWAGVAHVEDDERGAGAREEDTRAPIATAVRGRVAQASGHPVAGAEVILYSSFYLRQAYYDHRVREIGRAFTDAEGLFDLRPVDLDTVHFGRDGEVLVTVRHAHLPHLVAQRLQGLLPGQESDVGTLVLPEEGAVIVGQVRDLAGRPVPGAIVRVSGVMNPVEYDKTERLVVLLACPSATTDVEGRYRLEGFAAGEHEASVHIRLDCVLHERRLWQGTRDWSPRVRTGHDVRGRVVDADGEPLASAVVRGGGNWTPSNPDGTFWLDNVDDGPLTLDVNHHAWARKVFPGVATDGDPVVLALEARLPRVTLEVVDAGERPVALVAIDWLWAPGRGPDEFTPDSRYWHDPRGHFAVTVPDGVTGLVVSRDAREAATVQAVDLVDGARVPLRLLAPPSQDR